MASSLPNRESGPQNQPSANVAVIVSVGAAASMGGISCVIVAGDIFDIMLAPFSLVVLSERSVVPGLQPLNNRPAARPHKNITPTDRKQDPNQR